jgi:uncharacterized RDD family membrane protein YckC
MNIWEHLGLEPTVDTKAIKHAYAKKVKVIRPDEHPEPFQALHTAYKQALGLARRDCINQDVVTIAIDDCAAVNTAQPIIDHSLAKVVALLEDSSQRHILSSWEFLVENPLILDSSFNWQLGLKVFQLVAQYNQKNRSKRRLVHRVDSHIANYLNDIFNWKSEEFYLRSQLGDDLCEHLISLIVDRNQQVSDTRALAGLRGSKSVKQIRRVRKTPIEFYYFAGPIKRALAMLIDMLLAYPLAHLVFEANRQFIFSDISAAVLEQIFYATLISIYLITTWLFETSNLQATPGKKLFGLKVTDTRHSKLEALHGLTRSLIFGVTSVGFYITIIINNWLGGNFIHDRLSKSHVIDYRRSEREHNRRR